MRLLTSSRLLWLMNRNPTTKQTVLAAVRVLAGNLRCIDIVNKELTRYHSKCSIQKQKHPLIFFNLFASYCNFRDANGVPNEQRVAET